MGLADFCEPPFQEARARCCSSSLARLEPFQVESEGYIGVPSGILTMKSRGMTICFVEMKPLWSL